MGKKVLKKTTVLALAITLVISSFSAFTVFGEEQVSQSERAENTEKVQENTGDVKEETEGVENDATPNLETEQKEQIVIDSEESSISKDLANKAAKTTRATQYTVNELFGAGDYEYVKDGINQSLALANTNTSWTMTQIDSVKNLQIDLGGSLDFPSDFNVFKNMTSLTIQDVEQKKNISINYENTNSKLAMVSINNSPGIESISNCNIEYISDQYGTFQISDTSNLKEISNINAKNLRQMFVYARSLATEADDMIMENMMKNMYYDSAAETMINGLVDAYKYEDVLGVVGDSPLNITNINSEELMQLYVTQAHLGTFDLGGAPNITTINLDRIVKENVDDITINIPATNVGYGYNGEVRMTGVITKSVGDISIKTRTTEASMGNISLMAISADSLGERSFETCTASEVISSSAIKNIGLSIYNDENAATAPMAGYGRGFMGQYMGVYADKMEGIKIQSNKPMASEFYSLNLMSSDIGEFGNVVLDDRVSEKAQNYSNSTNVYFQGSQIKKIGDIILEPQIPEAMGGNYNASLSLQETVGIKEFGNIKLNSANTTLRFFKSMPEKLGNIDCKGISTDLVIDQLDKEGAVVKSIGNINFKKAEGQESAAYNANSININTKGPVDSIGNISIDGYNSFEDKIEIKDSSGNMTVDKIGSIYGNRIKTLELKDLKTRFLGELDLPIIETLDLSGDQLTRLKIKNNILPDTLTSYDFRGNQIPGEIPVKAAKRVLANHALNFFDWEDTDVENQSNLYIEENGTRYGEDGPFGSDVYTINVGADEELSADTLINLVRMETTGKGSRATATELFNHHYWKYGFAQDDSATPTVGSYSNEITLGDGSTVSGLQAGTNYLELSLYDAVKASGRNENAKIYFKIVKEKKAGEAGGKGTNAGKVTNIVKQKGGVSPITGDTGIIILAILLLGASSYCIYKRQMSKKA